MKLCKDCIFFDYAFNGTMIVCMHPYETKQGETEQEPILGITKMDEITKINWSPVETVRYNENLCGLKGKWWSEIPPGFNDVKEVVRGAKIYKISHEKRERIRAEKLALEK
jgi:hypothetical protein